MEPLKNCCADGWEWPAVLGMLMYPQVHSASCAPAAIPSRPLATFFRGSTAACKRRRGFSLIEVLIATAILATGLIAASRAAYVATTDQTHLRDRTLARWIAHNTLAEIRIQPQQLAAGTRLDRSVNQAGIAFTSITTVSATPSPLFSRVEVSVYRRHDPPQPDAQPLAQAVGFSSSLR